MPQAVVLLAPLVSTALRLITLVSWAGALAACTSAPRPPIDQTAALAVAREAIARREGWPEGVQVRPNITRSVCYQTARGADGSWTITAHRCLSENGSGNTGFESDSGRVIVISPAGKLIRYDRSPD